KGSKLLCLLCFLWLLSSSPLPDVALFEFPLDIEHEVVFRAAPNGRDEQAEWRLSEHALNDDVWIQTFHKIAEQVEILLVAKHTERPARIFGGQRGAAHDVQVMDLQSIHSGA